MPTQQQLDKVTKKVHKNLAKNMNYYLDLIAGESKNVDKHDKPVEATKKNTVDTFNGMKKADLRESVVEKAMSKGYSKEQVEAAIKNLKEKKGKDHDGDGDIDSDDYMMAKDKAIKGAKNEGVNEIGMFHDPRMSSGNFDHLTPDPKEDQLKTAYAALEKAEMDGDIRKQELALAAIDLIKGKLNEAMDGGQLFDYFASKGYVVKDRRPDGYPPKEGVEGYIVKDKEDNGRRSSAGQMVIFQYNKDTDQFTISQLGGYSIDQKEAYKAGMREEGGSSVAGMDYYITDGNYTPVDISAEGLKDIVDHVMGGLSREAKRQQDFYAARGKTSGTIDELKSKISSTVKEVIDSRKKKGFKVGDKVTYLGHPGEITKVNKEVTGDISYNVSYDKGNGKTKASNIHNKDGEIKTTSLSEVEEKLQMTYKGDPVNLQISKFGGTSEKPNETVLFIAVGGKGKRGSKGSKSALERRLKLLDQKVDKILFTGNDNITKEIKSFSKNDFKIK